MSNTYPNLNVVDFGAKGDGIADDTVPFRNALDQAGTAGGGIVVAPRGNYKIVGTISVPPAVTLEGVFTVPSYWDIAAFQGTLLMAYAGVGNLNGPPFITLAENSALKGISVYYPDQSMSNITPYPWTIRAGRTCSIIDVMLVNPYCGVDLASGDSSRHLIRGLYGQPLKYGISVDNCFDIGRIEDVHFWPMWDHFVNDNVKRFMATQGVALLMNQSDWQIVTNFFALGYHVGVFFARSAAGVTNGQFSNINFDASDVGIDFYEASPMGVQFSNLNIAAGDPQYFGIRTPVIGESTGGGGGMLNIRGASIWGPVRAEAIAWDSPGQLMIASSNLHNWGTGPAIRIGKGRAMVNGNYFREGGQGGSVQVAAGADNVIISDNMLNGNPILNLNGPQTKLGDNHD